MHPTRLINHTMRCPPIQELAILNDDAELAARLSCIYSLQGYYLPILDAQRMKRPDGRSEAVRRNNAIAKAGLTRVAPANLGAKQIDAMAQLLPSKSVLTIGAQDLYVRLPKAWIGLAYAVGRNGT